MMTNPMRSAGALFARYMKTYAHSPMSGSAMSNTSHHFSRTFMMSRGYARAATVRANSRHPRARIVDRRSSIVDRPLSGDDGRSTIDDRRRCV